MGIKEITQPDIIDIDKELRLRTPNKNQWEVALPWYENPKVLYYSEGVTDKVYDMEKIKGMYTYLGRVGELYFIEILESGVWKPIGDVTLSEENMPIAIGEEAYWGKGIGKKVIGSLIERARKIGLKKLQVPSIYLYNSRSESLFTSLGFIQINENEKEKSFELVL
ncbi:L-amino acid N-acyltransferase YncA [Clostridium punense]|uniref:L-amino acid N-acyltransferase YncA n=1 Tax=Clostridium punense TaxID=1054297 RepID=A0ABS4K676_9CLOT|nr:MULTISPECIES: GNAT family N-acetyltransferase [Clostridium]EQB86291.1 hypothetical protein M918_15240 [Clostridium sp. BL8]MBP2022651.1 L-amino acid N-acyltransferase YncA [Clostridium punense]